VADVGDNRRGSRPLDLWVVPEPDGTEEESAPARRYRARYPDGRARDAEALFVLPDGAVYLVNKGTRETVELWRWPTPLAAGADVKLERVRGLALEPEQVGDRVTGASASPDGRWVAVRTYSLLAIYRTADLLGAGEPAVRMDLTPLGEAQGEGVALGNDGTVVLTSESRNRHIPGSVAVLSCELPR
jgi:hypothetical protein